MQRKHKLVCTLVGMVVSLCLTSPASAAAQGDCQKILDVMSKVFTTPTHIYNTMTHVPFDGTTNRSETIYVGGSAYIKSGGTWERSPWPVQRVMKLEQENQKNSKETCSYVRDEAINGETAAVYKLHAERKFPSSNDLITSSGEIWISKQRELPLRLEEDIETGDTGKNHHSTRYEYANVRPPK